MTTVDEGLRPAESITEQPYGVLPVNIPIVPEDAEEEEKEPTGPDEISEFDQRYREPFTGLVFLGALRDEFTEFGHSFKIATPNVRERLAAGVLHKKYLNTLAAGEAWQALLVALYLEEVDGEELPEPLGPSPQAKIETRFNWVVDNLRDKVILRLFEKCIDLEQEVDRSLEELDRLAKS